MVFSTVGNISFSIFCYWDYVIVFLFYTDLVVYFIILSAREYVCLKLSHLQQATTTTAKQSINQIDNYMTNA